MIQIRQSVFETNSSSIHSICISKHKPVLPDAVDFRIGEYGWGCGSTNTQDYVYTAILLQDDPKRSDMLDKLKKILMEHNIEASFQEPEFEESSWRKGTFYLTNGYIDHYDGVSYMLDKIFEDEDLLLRCLFSPESIVYTGHDNMNAEEYLPCRAHQSTYYNWDTDEDVPNPYHDPDNFEYFVKGN